MRRRNDLVNKNEVGLLNLNPNNLEPKPNSITPRTGLVSLDGSFYSTVSTGECTSVSCCDYSLIIKGLAEWN